MAVTGAPAFRGRSRERQALDGMLDAARAGQSAALVLRGEAGIGKTALLRYCARQASGCRLVQVAGVESEMELPFAALHQLCAPMLGGLATLQGPRGRGLRAASGLTEGGAPARFLGGLAGLGRRAGGPGERP